MEQGGMNKRKAGEDFYFLQKIIALGGFTDLTETRVLPSARESDRVPFGTGRAVREYLSGKPKETYPIEAFLDLKAFLENLPSSIERFSPQWPKSISQFLATEGFEDVLCEIESNTSNPIAFQKRVLRWFDGFRAMKFVHYARDNFYGARAVPSEAHKLLSLVGERTARDETFSTRELLLRFRGLDRCSHLPNSKMERIEKGI